jgi:hypothetical protein
MMQKNTTFTTIYHIKKCLFHYDFSCEKVPLSLRYAKKNIALLLVSPLIIYVIQVLPPAR